ncbi:hypothetical protein HDU97_009098 [Phlyctochytrium planicorne]|nr:hypothetical protein HDU97_009098 [Phlyctochytrium planicorne]
MHPSTSTASTASSASSASSASYFLLFIASFILACSGVNAQTAIQNFGTPVSINAGSQTVTYSDGFSLTWTGPAVVLNVNMAASSPSPPDWINPTQQSYIVSQNISSISPTASRIVAMVPLSKIPAGIVASDYRVCRLNVISKTFTIGTNVGVKMSNGDVAITQDALDPQGEWIVAYKAGSGANVKNSGGVERMVSFGMVGMVVSGILALAL